jgi:hypothetical protein
MQKKSEPQSIDDLSTEGARGFRDLAWLCENVLPYGDGLRQSIMSNGCAVSSVVDFFEDNPGAIAAVYSWVIKNENLFGINTSNFSGETDDEDDEDADDDEEGECASQ